MIIKNLYVTNYKTTQYISYSSISDYWSGSWLAYQHFWPKGVKFCKKILNFGKKIVYYEGLKKGAWA